MMGKIICEVCGTVYPDSADCCPICGYSRDHGGFHQEAGFPDLEKETVPKFDSAPQESLEDFDLSEYADLAGMEYENQQFGQTQKPQQEQPRQPQQGRKPIFDYDAVNPRERKKFDTYEDVGNEVTLNDYPQDSYDNYDNYHERPAKSHTGLIIFLVLLIVALIAASAFLMFKFILPNLNPMDPVLPSETVMLTEAPTAQPTTEPAIPCESLALVEGGEVKLTREGQYYLIHATVTPEDTTDQLSYASENESIILVDAGGKITAVAEGVTNVVLTCGSQTVKVPVTVSYEEETAAPEETGEAAETDESAETKAAEDAAENAETQTADETDETADAAQGEEAAPEGETEEATAPAIELKLKKSDIMLGRQGIGYRLELDCPLDAVKDIEWSSTDVRVATVKDGVVTTVGPGTCQIIAKYGYQEVRCVIRCNF